MTLEAELAAVVGDDHVLTDPDLTAPYESDWTRRWSERARVVVRPGSVAEVIGVLRACVAHRAAVVPQGGNTGLVGGGVPHERGQVVLSTRRLTRLDPVDTVAGQVTAGAGVTIGELQRHVGAAGWQYAVDLAARDSATVGGTIATNAGGLHVVAWGDTRAQLRGIQAVLADGSVVSRLAGLAKDNTGYDLTGLFAGSEGTLGVVTTARFRLRRVPPSPPYVVLVGLPSVAAALPLLRQRGLTAAEIMLHDGVMLVCEITGLPRPLRGDHVAYLLLECAELPDLPDDLDAAVDQRLWDYRERHTEAISALGVPHKLDVSVPISRVPSFLADLPEAIGPHATFIFGHLADGNLHINVVGPDAADASVDEAVFRLVASYGGSISAEHGIGVAKVPWLGLSRSAAEVAVMRRIKQALDPAGLLNPGVLFARPLQTGS
jgi:FAD/FMN-containing dehydrogenase